MTKQVSAGKISGRTACRRSTTGRNTGLEPLGPVAGRHHGRRKIVQGRISFGEYRITGTYY